jgi:hypothetical protein
VGQRFNYAFCPSVASAPTAAATDGLSLFVVAMDPVHKTVLIAEDNDIAREGLAVILARHGSNAVMTSNGSVLQPR